MKLIEIQCYTCGNSFLRKPSKIGERNFCCTKCYWGYKGRFKIKTVCERCGKEVVKSPSGKTATNFCSRECHMKSLNEKLNPIRMTPEVREKIRLKKLGTGEGKTYEKTYGVHTHRLVAEKMLGRKLRKGEVVHHIDENKRNNSPENLMVFKNQSEHAEWHARNKKEVVPNEVQSI